MRRRWIQCRETHKLIPVEEYEWISPGGGLWHSDNWVSAPPDGNNVDAVFGQAIFADSTVSADVPVVVRSITFDSPYQYAIAGTKTVTLSSDTSLSRVNVLDGSHQFQTEVSLANDTIIQEL